MHCSGAHLTYCTNIHPGESWAEVFQNLKTHVLAVKAEVVPNAAFGVGLRLSARAAAALRDPETRSELQRFLHDNDLYVFTINGFPYGPFHAQPVKAAVYRPDWTDGERGRYTQDLAELLAELLPEGRMGSISTVPGGFKAEVTRPEQVSAVADQLLDQALALHRLNDETGRRISLALEPEPCCLLETTDETIEFFERHLLSDAALTRVARSAGGNRGAAEAIIRRHLGVCLDTCHAAIEFEEAGDTIDRLQSAGIAIAKIQLSTGLRLPGPSRDMLEALRAYDEPVYLHQVVTRSQQGRLARFDDLPLALASPEARSAAEWRVHFHVPLYDTDLGLFTNTQAYLARVLERQARAVISEQLEVETYTWDVLPPSKRTGSVVASIARELGWVLGQLGA